MPEGQTLGRGELHFAAFHPGTLVPGGERYIGNSPEFNLAMEVETLDHYDSDHGMKTKDESVDTQVDSSGSFVTDNVVPENLALFFFGTTSLATQTAATVGSYAIAKVNKGLSYQLGMTASNPGGARDLDPATPVAVTKGATTYVLDTDYTVDYPSGRITFLKGGTIVEGDDVSVAFTTLARTRQRVISGNKPIVGALRYIEFNAKGANKNWYMPYVKLSPNGEFALKSDEWQQIPFNVMMLKKPGAEFVYIDGQPYSA